MGPLEIILILVVLVLLFGARKLPELGKGLGQGIREFRSTTKDEPSNDVRPEERRE
ncbi:twin-arginine translocase TatA/TatE family subunit [Deinococcus sonorensis]|uniref:Sec-independent protein translocase protein TatA n=2 Tax=Deinococcus sonorensis TaxID=309891 RepID=A0AAU7UA58_9DEIO